MIVVAKKWDYEADRKPFHSAYQHQPCRVYPRFTRKHLSPLLCTLLTPAPSPPPSTWKTGILLDIPRPRTTLQRRPIIPRNRPTCRTLKRPCRCFAGYAKVAEGECEFESWREVGGDCHFLDVRWFLIFALVTELLTNEIKILFLVELKLSSVSSPSLSISVSRSKSHRLKDWIEPRSRSGQEAQICNMKRFEQGWVARGKSSVNAVD